MHEVTLKLREPAKVIERLRLAAELRDACAPLSLLANAIEEQVKPAIEEPEAFGSIVRAETNDYNRMLWHPSPMHGKHYWESETGAVEVWSELTDVEVLRVGLGEPVDARPDARYLVGVADTVAKVHMRLERLLADAITGERKNAYEKAIQAVEELAS